MVQSGSSVSGIVACREPVVCVTEASEQFRINIKAEQMRCVFVEGSHFFAIRTRDKAAAGKVSSVCVVTTGKVDTVVIGTGRDEFVPDLLTLTRYTRYGVWCED